VTVGDVAGSGLEAAVLMGNVRQVLRGAAHADADPRRMLEIADGTLRSEHEDAFVTAFVGIIDPKTRTMRYASAGHVPALLRSPDGAVEELDAPGLPLGMHALGPCLSRTAVLPEGSCLLLYTDGLIEWSRDVIAGEALLRRTLAEPSAVDAEHPAKRIVETILENRVARDDVAVLTVRFDG
jgi:serine phosphatase RsbU (regulator of sigma subunit)